MNMEDKDKICIWTKKENRIYRTECEHVMKFDGRDRVWTFSYCPFCGNKIVRTLFGALWVNNEKKKGK